MKAQLLNTKVWKHSTTLNNNLIYEKVSFEKPFFMRKCYNKYMEKRDIKKLILHNQHITNPCGMQQVVKDMCGLQAQFFNNPKYALKMRSHDYHESTWEENLLKTWTLRSTLHVIHEEDHGLFMSVHTLPSWFEKYNMHIDLEGIEAIVKKHLNGHLKISRKQLAVCLREAGFDEHTITIATNAWGGIFMKLCHTGDLVFSGLCERDFKYSDDFPMLDEKVAKKQLLERYFANYGPATLNDAAYFTKFKKSELKWLIQELQLASCDVENRTYFYKAHNDTIQDIPSVLLLGAFDPLLLGYEKKESLFLKQEHIRGIFNLTGIVFAPILYDGDIVGRWKLEKKVVRCELFEKLNRRQKDAIEKYALSQFQMCEDVIFEQFLFDHK